MILFRVCKIDIHESSYKPVLFIKHGGCSWKILPCEAIFGLTFLCYLLQTWTLHAVNVS